MDEVREIFETNYFGNVNVLRAVTPIMRKQDRAESSQWARWRAAW